MFAARLILAVTCQCDYITLMLQCNTCPILFTFTLLIETSEFMQHTVIIKLIAPYHGKREHKVDIQACCIADEMDSLYCLAL